MAVTLPVVNGSSGTWGTILNAALTDIDTRLTTATTSAGDLTTRVTNLENAPVSAGGLTVATSFSRPNPTVGQVVLETDTGFVYYVASVGGTPTRVPFPGSYVAKIKRTTAQTFGSGSLGALTFTAADFDRLAGWTSGSPTRYTAKVPGAYEFTGGVSYTANATGHRSATWYVGGVALNGATATIPGTAGEATVVVARPTIISLNVNEYVELWGQQGSGVTLTTDTTTAYQPGMQVKYLGYNA